MRISFIGPDRGTSRQRANALVRLKHEVTIVDPRSWLPRSVWVDRWLVHAGGLGIDGMLCRHIYREVSKNKPNFIWVDHGAYIGPEILKYLRRLEIPIVSYANDNPFAESVRSMRMRFNNYRRAIPYYDFVVVVFSENVVQAFNAGAKNVKRVFLSADEIEHSKHILTDEDHIRFDSDVSYIAQWAPERGPFIARLIELGVPISLWGDRWQRAKEWPTIKKCWRGPGMFDDRYAKVIQCTKVSLCLLSKIARNFHTGRSLQIPMLGSVLCAERSVEHSMLYEEGTEAIFWSDAEECAALCHELLADDTRRAVIARRGHERALRNNYFNEPMLASIIEAAMNVRREKQ